MQRCKTVDDFIVDSNQWNDELIKLREILTRLPVEECIKWGIPTYTAFGKNVVGICSFKSYFGLWFYQGALLKDAKNLLLNAQSGKTKAMRQWRMRSKKDIKPQTIRSYVKEAIDLAESGKSIKPDRNKPVVVPLELKAAFSKNKRAAAKFKALTLGRQREFANHIADAKRLETKQRRIEKILPMLIDGIGLGDKYRSSSN